eukprot:2382001-Pleurochrysis_carterae.AAC.1
MVVMTEANSLPLRCSLQMRKRTSRVCTCEKEAGHHRAVRQSASPSRDVPSKANDAYCPKSSRFTPASSILSI